MHLKKSNIYMNRNITNPNTRRPILKGGPAYQKLIRDGYVYDSETNTMMKFYKQSNHLLDTPMPISTAIPAALQPTLLQQVKKKNNRRKFRPNCKQAHSQ